ncbi:MAG: lysylphosphatidylglycerol synthase domain-containing protein [Gammaproteobacteria bacterium]|nr:lysylphosphatidylglycerol synthase domain-containing protein [Gammaproteobacteria bacterium]
MDSPVGFTPDNSPVTAPAYGAAVISWGAGIVLALAVVAGIHWYVGWGPLLAPWQELEVHALLLALGLAVAGYLARAVRLYLFFAGPTAGRFALTLKLVLLNTLANNLLPMRAGELSFPLLMRRFFAVPLGTATAALAWLRFMDLHTLLGLGLIGLLAGRMDGPWGWPLMAAWLALPWLAYRFQRAIPGWLGAGRWRRLGAAVAAGSPAHGRAFWECWLWSVLAWAAKLAVFVWLLTAFSGAAVEVALLGALGGELTSVLPFHGLAGMGTYEAGVVAAMAPFGVPLEAALAAAVNLHLFLLGVSVAGGALASLIREPRGHG